MFGGVLRSSLSISGHHIDLESRNVITPPLLYGYSSTRAQSDSERARFLVMTRLEIHVVVN